VEVTLVIRNALPEAHCGRPTVTVDGVLLRLTVQGSVATATRELVSGAAACAPLATIQYRQAQVTAHAARQVTGAAQPVCRTP